MSDYVNKQLTAEATIGEWVSENISYAEIFDKYQMDFCCGGNRQLKDVCIAQGVPLESILHELNDLTPNKTLDRKPAQMNLTELVDYIESEFHSEIRIQIPIIRQYLEKVLHAHGDNHSELIEVNALLTEGFDALLNHIEKEEQVLFPIVREIEKVQANPFVLHPIMAMEAEHDHEGDRFKKIAALTQGYQPPNDACNSFAYLYDLLKRFEHRLHLHIHIENNILFQKIKNSSHI